MLPLLQEVRNALTLTLVHAWFKLLSYCIKKKIKAPIFLENSTIIFETILHATVFRQPCRVGTKHKPVAAPIYGHENRASEKIIRLHDEDLFIFAW